MRTQNTKYTYICDVCGDEITSDSRKDGNPMIIVSWPDKTSKRPDERSFKDCCSWECVTRLGETDGGAHD